MTKRFSLRLLFSLCFLFCFSALLPAEQPEQSYLITESQLRTLETDYQTCSQSRQTALQQASALQTKAQKLQTDCSSLQTLLTAERTRTQNLNQSVTKLENTLQQQNEKYAKIQEENYGLQVKVRKGREKITVLSAVLIVWVLLTAVYIFMRVKKLLPF